MTTGCNTHLVLDASGKLDILKTYSWFATKEEAVAAFRIPLQETDLRIEEIAPGRWGCVVYDEGQKIGVV